VPCNICYNAHNLCVCVWLVDLCFIIIYICNVCVCVCVCVWLVDLCFIIIYICNVCVFVCICIQSGSSDGDGCTEKRRATNGADGQRHFSRDCDMVLL